MTWISLGNLIYPVGSIYISTASTSPSIIYGGTWTKITESRFLLSAGSITEDATTYTYNLGDVNGEINHTLVRDEMPEHKHYYQNASYQWGNTGESAYSYVILGSNGNNYGDISLTGGSQPHNNMPPYLVVNMWERTA